jgi:ArsR family transcriptional regulator
VPTDRDLTCTERHLADPASLAALQARLLATRTVESVADVFKLLGDPTRVRIVDALTHGERCVCDLATLLGLSESAVSHQLRLLRAARLVRVRRSGRLAYYSLDDHHVVGLLHDTRKHVEEGQASE